MWGVFSIPWMIDRVIAFYTVCLSICRERAPTMSLALGIWQASAILHSRISTYGSGNSSLHFSVYALLHVLEPLDLPPRIGRGSTIVPRLSAPTGQR